MVKIKNNDFIEIEYTGKVKDGPIFDTTDEKIAKDNNIYNEKILGEAWAESLNGYINCFIFWFFTVFNSE